MTRVLEWLVGLHDIRLGRDAPVRLEWHTPVEPWILVAGGLVVGAWVLSQYRRERTSRGRRTGLALMRCALIGLVVAALCQPLLVLQRDRVERSHVSLLVDTSMSMAAVDHYADGALAQAMADGASLGDADEVTRTSRLELAKRMLTRDHGAPLTALLKNNGINLRTFDASVLSHGFAWSAEELEPLIESVFEASPRGVTTDLPRAIRETIERSAGRHLSAIVLVSDGRSTVSTPLSDALDVSADRQIPIYPLRLGSPARRFDLEVGPLRAQETVFTNDIIVVEVQVVARGIDEPLDVTVRLVDEQTSDGVATADVQVPPGDKPMTVELRTRPAREGRITYRAEVTPLDGEVSSRNNADRVLVTVRDQRVKVLYVEGYPRYEYRYLKNALVREPTIDASVLLLEADKRFVQEGTDPIRRFPETPEELNQYDVVVFGDVDPRGGWLTTAQSDMLLEFVGRRGGGFGLIAGERAAPRFFAGTPIEPLIPIRIDPSFLGRYDAPLTKGFSARLTQAGHRSRLFRFSEDRRVSDRLFDGLPKLFWIARTLGPKPGATVLAENPSARSAFGAMPLLVTGRYGAGKILFQATDDTWRWRRHTGEALHDAYWIQFIRMLMPAGPAALERRFVIRTDRRTYPYGVPVRVQVEVFDAELLTEQRQTLDAVFLATDGDTADAPANEGKAVSATSITNPVSARNSEYDLVARVTLHRIGGQSNTFEASFIPPRPGHFVVEVADLPPKPGDTTPSAVVRVNRPDLELRRPEADHDALRRIASATGGRVVEPDELEAVFSSLRDRSMRIPDDIREPLWDSKLIFVLFVLMITVEWVLRKAFGLV